jgi:hypothetical protein
VEPGQSSPVVLVGEQAEDPAVACRPEVALALE